MDQVLSHRRSRLVRRTWAARRQCRGLMGSRRHPTNGASPTRSRLSHRVVHLGRSTCGLRKPLRGSSRCRRSCRARIPLRSSNRCRRMPRTSSPITCSTASSWGSSRPILRAATQLRHRRWHRHRVTPRCQSPLLAKNLVRGSLSCQDLPKEFRCYICPDISMRSRPICITFVSVCRKKQSGLQGFGLLYRVHGVQWAGPSSI